MLEKFRSYLLLISFLVIAGGLMLYMYVLASGDGDVFGGGEGTLEPVNFESLTFNAGDPGYLLCGTDICAKAEADGDAEPFAVDAGRLRQIVSDYSDAMPTIKIHHFDFIKSQFDFVERLPGETYPTVISVRILKDTSLSSKLVLFSYKPIGKSTSEEHRERAERWLAQLHSIADKR